MTLALILNCGSSSVKFAIIDPEQGDAQLTGLVEKIGSDDAQFHWRIGPGEKQTKALGKIDNQAALKEIADCIQNNKAIYEKVRVIGHRVVHGGEQFSESVVIDEVVVATIKRCIELAPLHNPANLAGIEFFTEIFPALPQVAVFDTAFHQSLPDYAYLYALPYELYEKQGVRKYGFHGTSHRFVTAEAAKQLNKPLAELALISAHLGNGCSLAAVKSGKSIDTTMGLTPLEGLVMGTRSGDVDPGLHEYLSLTLGLSLKEITNVLNKKSGLLGVSGRSMDMRELTIFAEEGDQRARLAIEIFCYRLAKQIAAMAVPLGRVDALIFTGGIGENSVNVREKVLLLLKVFGFVVDVKQNERHGVDSRGVITVDASPVAMVVSTNEELMIAQDAVAVSLSALQGPLRMTSRHSG